MKILSVIIRDQSRLFTATHGGVTVSIIIFLNCLFHTVHAKLLSNVAGTLKALHARTAHRNKPRPERAEAWLSPRRSMTSCCAQRSDWLFVTSLREYEVKQCKVDDRLMIQTLICMPKQ
jgi:hypothetical protein